MTMEKQAEFDELAKLRPAFGVDRDLLERQKQLGLYKPGDIVRYKGKPGVVSDVSVFSDSLKFTVVEMSKYGLPTRKKLVWYGNEEELTLIRRAIEK